MTTTDTQQHPAIQQRPAPAGVVDEQALHWAAMVVAAVIAARTTTWTKTALAAGAGVLLIAYALHVEHRHGAVSRLVPLPPTGSDQGRTTPS